MDISEIVPDRKRLGQTIVSNHRKMISKVDNVSSRVLEHYRSGHQVCHDKECPICIYGKMRRPRPSNNKDVVSAFNQKISVDLVGPMNKGVNSERYSVVGIDHWSRWVSTRPIVTKDQSSRFVDQWLSLYGAPKIWRSDNAQELVAGETRTTLLRAGALMESVTPFEHRRNGMVERVISSLCSITRCLLKHHNTDSKLWPFAFNYAARIKNLIPHASLGGKSPYEMRFGKKSDLSKLRLWGCKCYFKPPVEKVQKMARFDQTVQEGIFVGYDSITKDTPIIFDPKTETICLTHSVVYFETDPDTSIVLDPKFMSHIDDVDDENKDIEMSDLDFDFSKNTCDLRMKIN